jgi:hypothetical protein
MRLKRGNNLEYFDKSVNMQSRSPNKSTIMESMDKPMSRSFYKKITKQNNDYES